MKKLNLNKLAIAAAIVATCGVAHATDSNSGTLGVSAAIAPECNVQENTAIAFGNLSLLTGIAQSSTDDTAVGSVDAICTAGTPTPQFRYTATNGSFQLTGVTDPLQLINYTLYQNADALTSPVTYNTETAHPDFLADGVAHNLTLAARIAPSEKNGKSVQSYADTITVTTTFTP
jgi:spore coat protein U-like protein